ncbi:MAG: amidophosphoribosyltransferase [Deltaproteobacteria bacterium]|nr:amidophosphoribosyltransferase [Deltaproteobacteria bacterium]
MALVIHDNCGALHSKSAVDDLDDHFRDECGIFSVYAHLEATNLCYLGLHALQHRGQESAGIVSVDGETTHVHRGMGLVQDVFNPATIAQLPGDIAIGHVRYSTAGGSHLRNAQPFAVDVRGQSLSVAHNGNFTNTEELRRILEARGAIFQTTTDTELLLHLVAHAPQDKVVDRVLHALSQIEGAYSMLVLAGDTLIAARDPHGIRPMCLGIINRAHVIASEPTAFELITAEYVREIEPGEVLVFTRSSVESLKPFAPAPPRMCVFEYVYFARPDSRLEGRSVYQARRAMGHALAEQSPVEADVVIAVPDSGVPAAVGFAERSGIPFQMGLIRSHYVGRTFIEPQQSIRHFGVRLKLSPVRDLLEGKRVVVVDDSIVRGTTSRKIVKMLRDAGAREVHLRISSPPTRWPCFYGIDTPNRRELIAATHTTSEISRYITSDSLEYLSIEGLRRAVGYDPVRGDGFCEACFSGEYPISIVPVERLTRNA